MKTIEIDGVKYTFDETKDQILDRGIIDPYDLSPKRNEWVVIEPYVFWSSRLQQAITAPRWFITDLASVPRMLRWFISVNERHRLAAVAHDVGYRLLSYEMTGVSRKDWDLVLYDFCLLCGVRPWKAKLMYLGVRAGGSFALKNKTDLFAPLDHRKTYKTWYPHLELPLEPGYLNRV